MKNLKTFKMSTKLKIVYTIPSLSGRGGTEKVLITKANYLAEIGYEIFILISDQKNKEISFPLSDKVQIINLNISSIINNRLKFISFFLNILKLRKVYSNEILKINPEIVIVLERGYEDFVIPKILKKIPKIRELHSSKKAVDLIFNTSLKGRLLTALYNLYIQKYNHVVCLTQEDLIYRKLKNSCSVIPNVIEHVQPFPNCIKNKNIISVGRLDKYKNFRDQILIMKNIVTKHPEYKLNIFGIGNENLNLQNLIKVNNLQNNVFLRGMSDDIVKQYAQSDFFIFTSLAEGFGIVLIEALQQGLPVISYNCPSGPSEIIENNIDGFLIETGDLESFEEKILYLIESPTERELMSKKAVEKSKLYSVTEIMPKWIELFHTIIHK